jgi:transcriptional regulator with XRE-family HTH domain
MTLGGSRVLQQRRLRAELRRLRESGGHTQKTAAAGLDWSTSKIIRIETGVVQVSSSDVRAMLHFYGVTDPTKTQDLLAITRARDEAWWDSYRSVYRQQFLDYLAYEDSATHIRQFISFVLPGLLQTEEYMRRLFQGYRDDETWIERAVQARTRRQQILAPGSGKRASFIIDEAALQRWIGGQDVTRRQFEHLRAMAKQPNISIRLVPFAVGMHPGMRGSFTILDFESDDEGTIVSIESLESDAIEDDLETTSTFLDIFTILEDIATPKQEFDTALDAVVDRMRLDT